MSVAPSSAAGVWSTLYARELCGNTTPQTPEPFPNVILVIRKRVAARGDDVDGDNIDSRREKKAEIERK